MLAGDHVVTEGNQDMVMHEHVSSQVTLTHEYISTVFSLINAHSFLNAPLQ